MTGSELILRSIDTLKHTLIEELIVVSHRHPDLPLAHPERAGAYADTPLAVLISFIPIRAMA